MRNDLGVPLYSYVFDPVEDIFAASIENYARAQIERWETRVTVEAVSAARREEADGSLSVTLTIQYEIIGTGRRDQTKLNQTFVRAGQ